MLGLLYTCVCPLTPNSHLEGPYGAEKIPIVGYTVALNRLDGVYYVDPRPRMITDERLREEIHDFQHFLTHDLWVLSEAAD